MNKREYFASALTILLVIGLMVYCFVHPTIIHNETHKANLNGVSLVYEMRGYTRGEPVVLLHGNGGSHNDLQTIAKVLSDSGYLVWSPDSRGQGANEPLTEYHYADMAEDMHLFVNQIIQNHYPERMVKPAVFGWSDGGIVALMTEVMYPLTWSAIITSGANIDPDCGAWDLKKERAHPSDTSALYQMMLYEPNMTAADMQTIKCPALIVAGEHDLIRLDHTRLIGDNIPNGEVLIIPDADHGSHIINSFEMADTLLHYLRKINY